MISFFSKKKFLVDFLDGFIDIHNHILPGIDDGAKTVEDSITLIKEFSEFGVSKFIASPHIMHNYHPNTPETINSSLLLVKDKLLKKDLRNISMDAAAEHMIDDNFEAILEENQIMPLRKDSLLVEMSYLQPSINFDQALTKIAKKRYYTILAHPERYLYLHSKYSTYNSYKEKGILFQLNLLSLGEYYGKDVNKIALKLIQDGMIDYVASDVHNTKQLNALKNLTISKKVSEKIIPIINNTIETFY